jgi:hypothetical protein
LALALLAMAGFVAPLAEREADGVVQTSGASGARVRAQPSPRLEPAALETTVFETTRVFETPEPAVTPAAAASLRRYLLHRAWLI